MSKIEDIERKLEARRRKEEARLIKQENKSNPLFNAEPILNTTRNNNKKKVKELIKESKQQKKENKEEFFTSYTSMKPRRNFPIGGVLVFILVSSFIGFLFIGNINMISSDESNIQYNTTEVKITKDISDINTDGITDIVFSMLTWGLPLMIGISIFGRLFSRDEF